MTRVDAVAAATAGTALLAGALVPLVRAGMPAPGVLAWAVVALVAVAAFLARVRPATLTEALTLAVPIAAGQTLAVVGCLAVLAGAVPASALVVRIGVALLALDGLTLAGASWAVRAFPGPRDVRR